MTAPSNEEAWDFAVWALWEHYWELRAGAKASGLTLTPAEVDRLAHNMVLPKRPKGRPARNTPPLPLLKALTDLQARLLAGENLTLSAAECELLAAHLTVPNPPNKSPDLVGLRHLKNKSSDLVGPRGCCRSSAPSVFKWPHTDSRGGRYEHYRATRRS
jgi:hypothetical protein